MTTTTTTPLKIYLIRHGETAWSLSGQHTGRTDIALTEHGQQQAYGLGMRLYGVDFSRIFTSPRQRAQHTAALSELTPAEEIESDLAEWN